MSIAPPPQQAAPSGPSPVSAADQLIDDRITEACKALWWAELTRSILRLVIAGIGLLLVWIVADQWVYSPGQSIRSVIWVGALGGFAWYLWRRVIPLLGSSIQPEYAARSLEKDLPALHQDLTSYVTLRDDQNAKSLHSRVVRSIGSQAAGRLKRHDTLPEEATGTLRLWLITAITLALLLGYCVVSPKNPLQSAARLVAPLASIDPAKRVSIDDVQPGNVEAIAGRVVNVSAKIDGMRDQEEAICQWSLPASRPQVVLRLDASTRRYVGDLSLPHSARGQIDYLIVAGDATSGPYHLQVKNVPVVALQSVQYEPPAYTGESPHTSSSGSIKALDGTRVTILAQTNRAVTKAKLEFNPKVLGDRIQATAGATEMTIGANGTSLSLSFPLRSARGRSAAVEPENYRIKVWDDSGQSNPKPIVYPIRVIADLPPEVSIVLPTKSSQDLPINLQQAIEVHASDPDYGLKQVSLEIRSGIDLIAEPMLWSDTDDDAGNRVTEYRFRPTRHGLRIGDVVQIVAVAIDNRTIDHDPSVEPNTVRSDPVELRIVADDSAIPQDDPEANGISRPEEQPAEKNDKQDSSKSGGSEGEQSAGGGSGGSGEGETKSGEGDPQGGQSGSNGGQDQSEAQGGSDGDSASGTDPDQMSEDRQGKSSQENGGSSDADSQAHSEAGTQGNQASGESQSGDNDQGGDNQNQSKQSQQKGSQQNGTEQNGTEQNGGGQKGTGQKGGGQNSSGQNDKAEQSNQGGQNGEEHGQPNSQDDTGDDTPEHDGDAFEKIRDFIEEKRKQQDSDSNQNGSQGSSNQENDSGSGGLSENPQEGDTTESQDGKTQENQSSTDQRSGTKPEDNQSDASQGKGSPKDADNEPMNSQNDDGQSSGSDPSDRSNQKDSGNKDSGNSESGDDHSREAEGDPAGDPSGQNDSPENSKQQPRDAAGEQGSGDQKSGDQKSGDQKSGDQGSGEANPGDQKSSDQKSSDQNSSDQNSSDQGSGDQNSGEQNSGEQGSGEANPGEQGSSDAKQGDSDSKNSGEPTSDPSQRAPKNRAESSQPSSDQPSSDSADQNFDGTGSETNGDGKAGDSQTPDPVNLDYAKEATDMVLDYLEETRESPDRELLDKLKWSPDDLKKFADRWDKIRKTPGENPGEKANREANEALESLGMRPPVGDANNNLREQADSLRSIRDSGNRKPPPAAFRDAFEAFRRSMGKTPRPSLD